MLLEKKVKENLKKLKINKKSKIVVALSGGKDSAVTAYLLKKFGYNVVGFHIYLGMGEYSKKCLNAVEKLCENLKIKLNIYDIKQEMGNSMCYLRTAIQEKNKSSGNYLKNCAICGVIKKSIMNREARHLDAEFIATGHNLDDEAQTFLMNVLKGSPQLSANSGIITQNKKDKKFITRIKPLFYIPENQVRKFSKNKKLPVHYEPCPCAIDSYRIQVRKFLNQLSDKEKLNIIKNFERVQEKLKKENQKSLRYCENCGEPCRKKLCKMCELMK